MSAHFLLLFVVRIFGDTGNPADFKWGFLAAAIVMIFSLLVYVAKNNRYLVAPNGDAIGIIPASKAEENKTSKNERPKQN